MIALLVLMLVSALADADVAGNWRVEFVVPAGERAVNMTINQDGARLTGRVVGEDGQFQLEGSVKDDEVTVTWTVADQGDQLQITMKGKIEGDHISGTARIGKLGEGPLEAQRVSRNP